MRAFYMQVFDQAAVEQHNPLPFRLCFSMGGDDAAGVFYFLL